MNDSNIFNDLLQTNFNNNYPFAFVYDFDLTLTLKSADGFKYDNNFIELFDSENQLERLKDFLYKIKELGNTNYINTRALIKDVNYILNSVGLEIGTHKLIKQIKGSETIENIDNPFTGDELLKYNLNNINNPKILWGVKKVIYLNEISNIENIPKTNVLFFDDSSVNINTAKVNGYVNSYLIGSNDSGLIGLDYLLIKLQQILDIIYI